MTLGSPKQRTTWTMASTSRILDRNWLAQALAFDALFTSPANVHELDNGRSGFSELYISVSLSRRTSGTGTTPTFGSMVQNCNLLIPRQPLVPEPKEYFFRHWEVPRYLISYDYLPIIISYYSPLSYHKTGEMKAEMFNRQMSITRLWREEYSTGIPINPKQ